MQCCFGIGCSLCLSKYIQAYIIALPYLPAAHVSRVNGLHVAYSCLPRAMTVMVSNARTELNGPVGV